MKSLFIALFLCTTTFAAATTEATQATSKFKFGVGFSSSNLGYGVGFDVNSPTFLSWTHNEQLMELSFFLDYTMQAIPNMAAVSGHVTESTLDNFALGLRLTREPRGGWVNPYFSAGVLYGIVDKNLSATQGTWGMLTSLGADIFFVRSEKGLFGGKFDASFFVQADIFVDSKIADLITTQPKVYPVIAPRIGYRQHF